MRLAMAIRSHAMTGTSAAWLLGLAGGLLLTLCGARAFEVPADEKDKLKSCEKSICEIILKRETAGPDLTCNLAKTWAHDAIKSSIGRASLEWTLGDARCSVDLTVKRADLLSALGPGEYQLTIPEHIAKCELEGSDEISVVTIALAPKLTLKDGVAQSLSMGVGKIEGPTLIKGAIWTAATIEEKLGLFQGQLVEEVNEFVQKKCAKRYGG